MSKYTPGPWEVILGTTIIKDDDGVRKVITSCPDSTKYIDTVPLEDNYANAQLISAAPELLEALILILPLAKGYVANNRVGSNERYLKIAEQAITKAQLNTK